MPVEKNEEILKCIEEIFRRVFDDDNMVVTELTTPSDIDDWDSVNYMYIVAELEDKYGLEFDDRIFEIKNVYDIVKLIEEKHI